MSSIIPFGSGQIAPIVFNSDNGQQTFLDSTKPIISTSRISIRSGKFRMEIGGQEQGVTTDPIDVIVLRMSPYILRQYYGRPYNPQDQSPPACFSNGDTDGPHPNAISPQNKTCSGCRHNVKGSSSVGTGKACGSRLKIAVLLANNIMGSKIFEIDIPPASLWGDTEKVGDTVRAGFNGLVRYLGERKIDSRSAVIRISMDEASSTPKLWFSPVGYVNATEQEAAHIEAQSQTTEAVEATIYTYRKPNAPTVTSAAPASANPFAATPSIPVDGPAVTGVIGGFTPPVPVADPAPPVATAPASTNGFSQAPVVDPVAAASAAAPASVTPPSNTEKLADMLNSWDTDEV
jgi:hypothetical protein